MHSKLRTLPSLKYMALLVIMLYLTSSAISGPMTPTSLYGNITIDGVDAPINTTIIAKVDGIERARLTMNLPFHKKNPGKYGGTGFDPKLTIQNNASDYGKEVTFWVNSIQANQIAVLDGNTHKLDLTFTTNAKEPINLTRITPKKPVTAVTINTPTIKTTAGNKLLSFEVLLMIIGLLIILLLLIFYLKRKKT